MTKEKQIEDMASIICRSSSNKGECDTCGFFEHKACSKFEEANDLYDAGYRKQSEDAWISVDERLPDDFGIYMCYGYWNYDGATRIDIAQFYGKWQTFDEFVVTHWMPLPKTPNLKGGAK